MKKITLTFFAVALFACASMAQKATSEKALTGEKRVKTTAPAISQEAAATEATVEIDKSRKMAKQGSSTVVVLSHEEQVTEMQAKLSQQEVNSEAYLKIKSKLDALQEGE